MLTSSLTNGTAQVVSLYSGLGAKLMVGYPYLANDYDVKLLCIYKLFIDFNYHLFL